MLVLSCSSPCHAVATRQSRQSWCPGPRPPTGGGCPALLSSRSLMPCRPILPRRPATCGGAALLSPPRATGMEYWWPRRQHQLPAPVCHMPRSLSPRMPPVAGGGAASVRSLFILTATSVGGRPSVSRSTSRLSRPHLGVAAVGSRGSWRSGATGSG